MKTAEIKIELLKKLNCATEQEAIEKLNVLIESLTNEIEDVQFNPNYINVRAMKVNTLASKKDQAQKFIDILKK